MGAPTRPRPAREPGRQRRELLCALRSLALLTAVVVLSPLTGFAYRFARGTHSALFSAAYRNALLGVPLLFLLIWLALYGGQRLLQSRSRDL